MKPKNSKERQSSFFRFLGLFLLTVITILVAVYFNFKIPSKENKQLREQATIINKDIKFQNEFYNNMKVINNLLDSLNSIKDSEVYVDVLKKSIIERLYDLEKTIPTNYSTNRFDFYMDITSLYTELLEGKVKLRSLSNAEAEIEEYGEALEDCRRKLEEANKELRVSYKNR